MADFMYHVAVLASLVCTFLIVGGVLVAFIVGSCEFMWPGDEQ